MEFKKGDRVVVVSVGEGDAYYTHDLVGQEGTIARDKQSGSYACVYVKIKGKEYNFLPSVELKLCLLIKAGMKFQVGDKVKQIHGGWNTAYEDTGKEAIVTEVGLYYTSDDNGIKIELIGNWNWKTDGIRGEDAFELVRRDVTNNKGGEEVMLRDVIVDNFGSGKDCNLVESHLGKHIKDDFISRLFIEQNKDAILVEAKRLEVEAQKAKDKE